MTVHTPPNVNNATILILSSTPGFYDYSGYPVDGVSRLENPPYPSMGKGLPGQPTIDDSYALIISAKSGGSVAYQFSIENDTEQTNAYLYGHLPAIGTLDYPGSVVFAEGYKGASHRIRDVLLTTQFINFQQEEVMFDLGDTLMPYGGVHGEEFWAPAKLSITETQTGLAATIANQQINYMTQAGKASGPDYVWQGSTYLEPVFQATKGDALQGESSYAFRSGILFGVVGAAAIAFVQEIKIPKKFSLPEWWPRRKRKRKPSPQNAVDAEPDSTVDEKKEVDAKFIGITSRSPTGLGWPSSQSNVLRRAARYRSSHQIANARSAMRAPQPRKDRD